MVCEQKKELVEKLGVDRNEFRAKDLNQGAMYGPFMGQGLMAMVRRGFLTKVRQEREQIQIAEYSYKFKNLETGKTITEWYLNADSDYFNKEKFEDLTDYITVNSRFNVYKFNADQVVNYKTILVETVQAL